MGRLIFLLFLLIASVYLGLNIMHHPGYLLVVYQPWMVQMPLWVALIGSVVFLLLFYWLITSIDRLQFWWFRFKNWLKIRKAHRKFNKTQQGLAYLIEKQWSKAEYLLKNGVQDTFEPLVNYLGAAKAAHEQKAYDRRDGYIRMAHRAAPDAHVAIGLTQARLEFSQENVQRAAAILQHLRQSTPKHPGVLQFLEKIYVQTADWENLHALLPDLRKAKIISREQYQQFEKNIYVAKFNQLHGERDLKQCVKLWNSLARSLRREPDVVHAYLNQLLKQPGDEHYKEAATLIRKALSHTWSNELARCYALLPTSDINRELVMAGAWLKQYGEKPILLQTLGRLCVKAKLWGKAKDYFNRCLALGPDPQVSLEYGRLLEELGEKDEATAVYQAGLKAQIAT